MEDRRRYREENNIPINASLLCCTSIVVNKIDLDGNWDVFVWKDNNILNFYGTDYSFGKKSIPTENIQFYIMKGDSSVEVVTEGGGVSVGKAIIGSLVGAIIGGILGSLVGAFIAFGVGAILAGRNKITTTSKEIITKKIYLNYLEENENKQMIFTSEAYEDLLKLIPEKEMSYIQNYRIIEDDKSQNDNIYINIEKLAELKDKGILTEDEFNQKKKSLLDKI